MKQPEAVVSALIFNNENKVLLCRSHKWNNQYVIPGGHIETGEPMEEALRREIKEETGLEIYDIRPLSVHESIFSEQFYSERHFVCIDFICRTETEEVVLNDEASQFIWVSLEDIDRVDLGGVVRPLLNEMKKGRESGKRVELYYDY